MTVTFKALGAVIIAGGIAAAAVKLKEKPPSPLKVHPECIALRDKCLELTEPMEMADPNRCDPLAAKCERERE